MLAAWVPPIFSPSICRINLGAGGLLVDEVMPFLANVPPRSVCAQYRESDFDFVTRLLTEEGLGWRYEEARSPECRSPPYPDEAYGGHGFLCPRGKGPKNPTP